MGYTIYLIDRNKSITEKIVDSLVNKLPKRLRDESWSGKREWGWSFTSEIRIKKNKNNIGYLCVSGIYGGTTGAKYALDMVLALQQLLFKKNYKIEIFSSDFGYLDMELYEWMGNDPADLDNETDYPWQQK